MEDPEEPGLGCSDPFESNVLSGRGLCSPKENQVGKTIGVHYRFLPWICSGSGHKDTEGTSAIN